MPSSPPRLKLLSPDRSQGILLMQTHLDAFVEESHPVRAVWSFVEGLDMAPFHKLIRSREGEAGRPSIDPRLLLALWMFATVDATDSGRKLARLCRESLPYRWLCGGVPVEYHTLNDFRSEHVIQLRALLTSSVSALISEGLVHLDTVALDGVRVRASAGSSSFRSAKRLRELVDAVDKHVVDMMERWKQDGTDPEAPGPKRKRRALEERKSRLEKALRVATELDEARSTRLRTDKKMNKEKREKLRASLERGSRASTTDPESAVLHMADNGHRPAYNTYVSTEATHGFIVDAHVTANAVDNSEIPHAVERLRAEFGPRVAEKVLADSGFRSEAVIAAMEEKGVSVYTPVPEPRGRRNRSDPTEEQTEALARWRERMVRAEGASLYARRGQLVEFAFANFRNRGLRQYRVRGPERCEAVTLLHSLTHNMILAQALARRNQKAA